MEILIRNGMVVTQNARREVKKANILVEGNRIKEIGNVEKNAEEIIDARGKLVLPGLINTHNHAPMVLFRGYGDDMQLHDWLGKKIWPLERKLDAQTTYAGALLACLEMVRGGTTAFADMYFFSEEIARACEKIGMRGMVSYATIDVDDEKKCASEMKEAESFFRKIKEKKSELVIPSFAPHAPYTCSSEMLVKSAELAKKHRATLQIHVSETRKEVFDIQKKTGKRPVEYLDGLGVLSENVIAAHSVWLTKQEVGILGKKKVSVSHNPVSNMKLAGGGACPVPEMLSAGVNVSLGTDGAASNNSLSMFESMKFAALLQKHSRWDACILNAQQTLDFATINGARALGINAGSIEKGRLADIILVDLKKANNTPLHNPVSNLVYSCSAADVTHSIINGKLVMIDGKMLGVNEEEILEQAQMAAEKIVSK